MIALCRGCGRAMPPKTLNGAVRKYCTDACAGRSQKRDARRIYHLFIAGMPIKELAKRFKCCSVTVRKHLHSMGVGRIKTGPAPVKWCKVPECGKPARKLRTGGGKIGGRLCNKHTRQAWIEKNIRLGRRRPFKAAA